jgi:hypothetical protein
MGMKEHRNRHLNILLICIVGLVLPLVFGAFYVEESISKTPEIAAFNAAQQRVNIASTPIDADRFIKTNHGSIAVNENTKKLGGGVLNTRELLLTNGDTVISGSVQGDCRLDSSVYSFKIKGSATIHLHVGDQYTVEPLHEGIYNASLIFIDSAELDAAIYTPKQYRYIEYDSLEYIPENDGYLQVAKTGKGFEIDLMTVAVEDGCCSDYLLTTSRDDLLDWSEDDPDKAWINYSLDNHSRMTYTGYYMLSEPAYIPYGDKIFYRCQACYIGERFTREDMSNRAAQNFLASIVDTMTLQKNRLGFYPSTCFSLWLNQLYGMEPPYYDTRFNSDLMEIFISYYERSGAENALQALKDYEGFYMFLMKNSSWDDGNGGVWVNDYWAEDNDSTAVHTALNHQIAEMIVLYKVSQIAQRQDWKDAADSMLKAVENVGMDWVKPNGEFHYMVDKEGKLSEQDYDTLTYNDMYRLQALLEQDYGYRSEMIDNMMARKLEWMLNNGVHGYLGE